MNAIESAIAEHGDDIVPLHHRNEAMNNCIRIFLIERGPARFHDRLDHALRIESVGFRDLLQPRHFGNKNAIGQTQRIRQLLLENGTARGV